MKKYEEVKVEIINIDQDIVVSSPTEEWIPEFD